MKIVTAVATTIKLRVHLFRIWWFYAQLRFMRWVFNRFIKPAYYKYSPLFEEFPQDYDRYFGDSRHER